MINLETILKVLPIHIKEEIFKKKDIDKITEIRLRVDKNIYIYYGLVEEKLELKVTFEDLILILRNVSSNSIYSVQNDINNGFITIPGGHRIGVVGEVVLSGGKIKNIKNISSMNIRVAKEYIGISDRVIHCIKDNNNNVKNTIIVSPPLCGKTTLLRDIVRNISNSGKNVVVVDERGEIASMANGKCGLDVGDRTDVISYVPKEIGMQMAVRSMAPDVVFTDEIGTEEDTLAIKYLCRSGVNFVTTMHGYSLEDIMNSNIKELVLAGYVDVVISLSKANGIGTIHKIYADLKCLNSNNNLT